MNACFIPVIYFFYPESKKSSLEAIDLIFAKGYSENMRYVKASKEMPFLSEREVEDLASIMVLLIRIRRRKSGVRMRRGSRVRRRVPPPTRR